jgi:pimeloyl-ACP methyl ester carboxylesterase
MAEIIYKGSRIHFLSEGKGPAIVLLHGFLEDLSMWDELVPVLSGESRVIRIDLLGHGKSGILGEVHSMEEQARMARAVLSELEIEKYGLVGHSMGGYVALAMLELHPEEVRGICLMNSTSLPDSEEKRINRDRAISAVRQNHRSFVRIAVPGLFAPGNRERFAGEIKNLTRISLGMSPEGITAALEGMKIRADRSNLFEQSRVPKLLITGEQDPALDLESLMPQTRYPGVKAITFKDGHMSHIENREDLTRALLEFTREINPTRTHES